MRILLVEDGVFTRRVVGGAFEKIAKQVDYVASGEQAIISAQLNYDIILVATNLDYISVVDKIRANETKRNFIVLTTFMHERITSYETRGIDLVCSKPLNAKEAQHIVDMKDKNAKSIYRKAGFTTFKPYAAQNTSVDSGREVSTCDLVPVRKFNFGA